MITKIENNHGLCRDKQKNIICAYYNNGGRCKKPNYENCLDMVTDKSYIFVEVDLLKSCSNCNAKNCRGKRGFEIYCDGWEKFKINEADK